MRGYHLPLLVVLSLSLGQVSLPSHALSLEQEKRIDLEHLGFSYRLVVARELLCYIAEAKFIGRGLIIFLKQRDFNEQNLKSLFKHLSWQNPREEELHIRVFTDEDELLWYMTPRVGHSGSDKLIPDPIPMLEKLKNNLPPYAEFIRENGNEAFRYSLNKESKVVVLKGTDPYYSEEIGFPFEIIARGFLTSIDEVECEGRELEILIQSKDFNEENLTKLFKHLSNRFPQPKDLSVKVHTDIKRLQEYSQDDYKMRYFYALRFKSRVSGVSSSGVETDKKYLYASYYRTGGASYFQYTIYPFIINRHGGLEMRRVVLN